MENEIILHQHARVALEEIEVDLSLWNQFPDHFSVLIGPSDVGKTRVFEELESRAIAKGEKVIRFLGPGKSSSNFTWREFQTNFLKQFDYAFTHSRSERYIDDRWQNIYDLVEQERIDLILIDDSDFLNTAVSVNARASVVEQLRKMVDFLSAKVALSGTHHLQSIMTTEGQPINRCNLVYLDTYSRSDVLHVQAFMEFVEIIARRLDLPLSDQVFEDVDLLFEKSLGCVGSIYERLYYAQAYAQKRKADEIQMVDFNKAYKNHDPDGKRLEEIKTYVTQKNKRRKD